MNDSVRLKLTSGGPLVVLLSLCGPASTSIVLAAPPVPFYKSHVIAIERIGDGSVVIRTKDRAAVVYAWYRANLRNANGDTKTEDGAHILYTRSGTTIDIEPDAPGARGTNIGIVWNARKYGANVPTDGHRQSAPQK